MEFEFDKEYYEEYELQDVTIDEAIEDFYRVYSFKPTRAVFSNAASTVYKAGIKTHELNEGGPAILYLGPIIDWRDVMLDAFELANMLRLTLIICPDFSGAFIDDNSEIEMEWENLEDLTDVLWV